MSIYETGVLIAAATSYLVALSSKSGRAQFWIVAITIDFLFSTSYWRGDLPLADAVTALCDFSIAMAVFFLGYYRWELWLMLLFWSSMGVSIIDLSVPGVLSHDAYSSVLEVINYAAFILIGLNASFLRAGHDWIGASRPWLGLRPSWLPLLGEGPENRRK